MKTSTSLTFDASILPDQAQQELADFYHFLVGKYAKRRTSRKATASPSSGTTAADLAISSIVGIWKDRDLGDSATFARSLRETAQKRNLS